jgi:hypothetical protein
VLRPASVLVSSTTRYDEPQADDLQALGRRSAWSALPTT